MLIKIFAFLKSNNNNNNNNNNDDFYTNREVHTVPKVKVNKD